MPLRLPLPSRRGLSTKPALRKQLPPASIDNDAFFGGPSPTAPWPPRPGPASVPEVAFYGDARPPAEPGIVVRAAQRPLAFGSVLFLLGWLGILMQRSPLRQLVVGAPVFEECAKFGLALVVLALLGARSVAARLPYAWLSGLGFGVLEHVLSYSDEPWLFMLVRAAFHAAAAGLSMAVYSAVEPLPDVRVRWGSTLASSLVHWANNFGQVLVAILVAFAPALDGLSLWWAVAVTATAVALTFGVAASAGRFREAVAREVGRVLPPLGVTEAGPTTGPPGSGAPAPPGPPPPGAP